MFVVFIIFCAACISHRTTIQALERLSRLQTLNLKGNNLCNLKDIAAIQSMNELEHLYLSGNPIELSENYPNNVFDLQPHLRSIDHWGRADCYNELHSGSHDKSVSSKDFTCTPISSLEIELQATNEAFSLQERTLAANGEELARLCASLASPRSKKSSFGADLSETEVLENFPFYRLLQTWRKQALNCTMARTLAEHALQRAHRESQRDRQKLLDRARENEAKALLWKQRSAGWEDKCHSLEQAVRDRDQRLAAAAQEAEHRDQQLFNLQQQHRNLALYLKHMKTQADQWAVLQAAEVVRGADRLRQMEGRVAAAAERVAFAAEVVAQREVQVRNSLAALDAERRLMQLTNSNPHHPHAHQDQQVCSRGADGGPQHRGDADLGSTTTTTVGAHAAAHSSAEGVRLEPEAEALLRAIFRTMDPEDTGLVSVQLLIKCLVAETEAAKATLLQSHQHREHKEAESEGEEGEEGEDDDGLPSSTAAAAVAGVAVPTALGDMVRSAVGSVQWKRLVSALQALSRNNPHNNLTWGEFLLQFIPAPAPASRAGAGANGVISSPNAGSLTAAELRDLRKAGLLGDMDWGLIPLQLPTQLSAAAGGSGGSAGSNATIHQLQKQDHHSSPTSSRNRSPEHRQLLAERRYLMQRLQDMTRTLERRAEGIKAYFEGTIRREQLKDERKATQISELQHTLAVTQARQAELEQLLAHSKAQYDSRVPQLEAQVGYNLFNLFFIFENALFCFVIILLIFFRVHYNERTGGIPAGINARDPPGGSGKVRGYAAGGGEQGSHAGEQGGGAQEGLLQQGHQAQGPGV